MRFSAVVARALLAASLALALTPSQKGTVPNGLDPIKNFCSRIDHQSVIKNGMLYIDGGTEVFSFNDTKQKGSPVLGYNTFLIAVNMSTSWDWKTNISEVLINKTANVKTGTDPPLVVRAALYQGPPSDPNIYLYGGTTSYANTSFPGWLSPSSSQYTLWGYDTSASDSGWSQYDVSIAVPQRPSSGAYTEAPNLDLAFYFGGEIDSGSSLDTQYLGSFKHQFLNGMVVLYLNNQTAQNVSTASVQPNQPRTRGRLQYVPGIGPKGIIINLGGSYKPVNKVDKSTIGTMVEMNSISVFDVNSLYDGGGGAWYTQEATGDIPPTRVDFCMVMASAPDGSSHNIYVYGGRNDTDFHDDVYVLSLPSFTWIKIYEGQSPRFGMTCHFTGNRQMITVGGQTGLDNNCDWELMSVGVYDLSDLTWGSVYKAGAKPYTVPNLVSKAIGGNGNGSATVTAPPAGFATIGLARLFNSTFVFSNGTATNSTATSAPSSPTSASASYSPSAAAATATPVGAIAGGVVGGIAGLALIAALVFFLLRRRRQLSEVSELQTDHMTQSEREKASAIEKDGRMPQPDIDAELDISLRKHPPVELASPQSYVEMGSPRSYAELPAGGRETLGYRPDTKTVYSDNTGGAA